MSPWNPKYKTLDHWRGIAALWVMLFHGFGTTYGNTLHPLVELVKSIAAPGWLGVHLFFVISGYCISASVYKLGSSNIIPWAFIKNRFWRLFPTYWCAFLVALLLNVISSPFNKTSFWSNFPDSWQAWLGNLLLIQPYLNVPFYVVVYWSLVVEIGFYLIVTILLIINNIAGHKLAMFIGLFLAFTSVFIVPNAKLGFINNWCEFICGVLVFIALWARSCQKFYLRNLSLTLITTLGFLGIWVNWTIHSNQLWFSAIFSIVLYYLYPADNKISSIQQIQWLQFMGLMSYSLYLLHVPFQGRFINLVSRFISVDSLIFFIIQISSWIAAISASYIFYRLIEIPLNNWRYKLSKIRLV